MNWCCFSQTTEEELWVTLFWQTCHGSSLIPNLHDICVRRAPVKANASCLTPFSQKDPRWKECSRVVSVRGSLLAARRETGFFRESMRKAEMFCMYEAWSVKGLCNKTHKPCVFNGNTSSSRDWCNIQWQFDCCAHLLRGLVAKNWFACAKEIRALCFLYEVNSFT